MVGWSTDGRFALISDNYDVWRIGMGGRSWVNLTGNGRATRTRYTRVITTDPRERFIDLSKPVYMAAMQALTKKEAIVRIDPAKPGAVAITGWRDARHAPMKARDAERGIGFVDRAVGFHAQVPFGDFLACRQPGPATVARARVDLVETHHQRTKCSL